ncbi:MAG TPA: XRE family transcriptional regulator [Chromatiales bacterium]|nr:XRE family transcriptional regulator [Chromatiales bacterium]
MKVTPAEQATFRALLDEIEQRALQQGLRKRDLAQRAGISPESYSRMKRRGSGDYHTLNRMARAVGLRLSLVPDHPLLESLRKGAFFE